MGIFARVVETESFTAAADRLGLSRAAVSKRIQQLEEDLGARLLNRTTRQVLPTEIGRAYYDRCLRVLHEAEDAENFVRQLHNEPRGLLRINAPQSFGTLHLAPALARFASAYPDLGLSITLNDRTVSLFEEDYDVALRVARAVPATLIGHRICPIKIVLVAAPDYLKRNGRPVHPDDLTKHTCLQYSYLATGNAWALRGPDGEHRVPVVSPFIANSGDMLLEAAIAGLGVTIVPKFIAWCAIASGRVETVLDDYASPDLSLFAVYVPERQPSAKVRLLVEFLSERFGPEPYWDAPPAATREMAVPPD
jgi:DNA-binding transcriptional LysR family regulator